MTDFSKVRSVKIVLKDGQALKSKEELNILLPSKIPGDTSLKEEKDVAVNSSAFSTDGTNYTEGNITKVRFTTYKVTGIAFLDRDKDKDGRYNSNDDRLRKNVTVKVLNKDGGQAVDFNNKPIIGKTDENGAYSLPVYKRGNYVVAFEKTAAQKFNKKSSGEEKEANSIDPATIKDNTAQTAAFSLNPAHRSQVKNVALLAQYGQIKIIKTSENEKDANGQPMKLAGVEFALTTQDGQPVQDDQDKTIANVTTDEKGEAIFKGIPYGDYVVKEVKAADRYAMPTSGTNVTVSDKTAPDSDKPIVVNITNVLIRGTITIHKTDASSRKKPLAGVEFTLYDDQGKEIAKKTTDKNGDITFADLVYGAYTVKETKGLRGYCAFKQDIIVEIKENGKTYHYDVENKAFHYPPTSNPSTPTLPVKPQPKTGDSNRLLFWSALLGMSTLSLTFLYAAREKTRSRKKR